MLLLLLLLLQLLLLLILQLRHEQRTVLRQLQGKLVLAARRRQMPVVGHRVNRLLVREDGVACRKSKSPCQTARKMRAPGLF